MHQVSISRDYDKIQHFVDNHILPKIPANYTQVYDEISANKQFIADIL